jgi:type VI secretion system protein ImpF
MSRISPQQSLKPSILDRLIDPDSAGTAWRLGYGLQQVLEVVRRDLEDLLNTRQTAAGPPGLQKSIYAYGLPDLTSFEAITPKQKEALGRYLEQTIRTFEPRLQDIQATLSAADAQDERKLAFRVDARLSVEPYDDVTFQTILELTTGHYSVQKTPT